MYKQSYFLILFSLLALSATAQKRKIEITQCDVMSGDRYVRRLQGNVAFRHENATMYCDSARLYVADNRFEAFSNVRIIDGTVTIYADTLFYSSQTSLAQLRGRITMTNRDMTLTTRKLDYNVRENVGYYPDKGKITDRSNTLTSVVGLYYVKENLIQFKKNVVLVNADYTIRTDTLSYHTISKVASFMGPTRVESKQNLIYTERGWYNTETNIAQGVKKSFLQSKSYYVYGDTLNYNRNTDIGTAHRNVQIIDTTEKITLLGNKGFLNGKQRLAFATGNLQVVKDFDGDSLFMHADSVFSQRFTMANPAKNAGDSIAQADSIEYNVVKAFHKVRFYKSDLQGVCDSLNYNSSDSLIVLLNRPIIWHEANQLTGRTVQLRLKNDKIEEIFVDANAFLVEQDDSTRFNQMKGNTLTGYIKDNKLYRVDIQKNGEAVYFMRDNDELVGVNNLLCNDMTANLINGKLSSFVFRKKPEGFIDPPNDEKDAEVKLDNFQWFSTVRPLNRLDIFNWR
ncbi:MAG: hypothetical protein LBU90_10935 [Bacteroidales bacterium]|nr:hypothetical protein [Bacteroidales bacterium]